MVMKVKLGGGDSFRYDGNDGFGEEKIPVICRAVTSNIEGKLRLLARCFGGREVTLTTLDHHSARGRRKRCRVGQSKKDSWLTDGTGQVGSFQNLDHKKKSFSRSPRKNAALSAHWWSLRETRFGTLGSRMERSFVLV